MATLTYDATVYSETLTLLTFSDVVKYLTAQFDPIIDPSIIRPGDAYRFAASS
jgi:hypothetical protein